MQQPLFSCTHTISLLKSKYVVLGFHFVEESIEKVFCLVNVFIKDTKIDLYLDTTLYTFLVSQGWSNLVEVNQSLSILLDPLMNADHDPPIHMYRHFFPFRPPSGSQME